MPKMRETSTVRHELALVRAYLSIARMRMGERLAFSIDPVDGRIADARMPAMILLPLVDHAIAHGPTEWHANGSIRIPLHDARLARIRLEIVAEWRAHRSAQRRRRQYRGRARTPRSALWPHVPRLRSSAVKRATL